jgi:hypothetical protein
LFEIRFTRRSLTRTPPFPRKQLNCSDNLERKRKKACTEGKPSTISNMLSECEHPPLPAPTSPSQDPWKPTPASTCAPTGTRARCTRTFSSPPSNAARARTHADENSAGKRLPLARSVGHHPLPSSDSPLPVCARPPRLPAKRGICFGEGASRSVQTTGDPCGDRFRLLFAQAHSRAFRHNH